ncbi:MAG: hypothetical protein KDA85_04715 [Planctomycetaceae bacterium]|nr:hypothetical protein [Planctomycetaceae bacterium]
MLAPFAIYRGAKAKRLIRENNVGHEHQGMAQAGFIIGIISLVINIILLLFWALSLVIAIANNGGRNF